MNKRHSILRFLLIYLCVLLPLLGTSILITQNFLVRAQREESGKLIGQLEEVGNLISESFWDYRNKGVVLFENKEFSSKAVLFDTFAAKEAVRMLQSLRLFDNSENNILIYYGEGDLYSPDGLASPNTFFGKTMACTQDSVAEAVKTLSSAEFSIQLLQGGSSGGYILYHIPVGKDHYGYMRSMEVLISFSQLEDMIESCLKSEHVILRLGSGEKEVWFYYGGQQLHYVTAEYIDSIWKEYKESKLEYTNEELGIHIQLWGNVEEQLAEFYKLRNINIILLTVGLLISVAISLWLSVKRFSQLKSLVNNVVHKNVSAREKRKWVRNEFDYIQMVLDESMKENISVRKNARLYRKSLFRQIGTLIFHGLIRGREEIQSLLKVCGTELFEEYFFLYGLRAESDEQLHRLDELFQGDIHCVINENGRRFMIALCELPCFDFNMKKRHELSQKLQEVLEGVGITCNQIAVSQVYTQISMANYAYLEVLSILENNAEKEAFVLCWEEWTKFSGKVSVRFGDEYLKSFREAVAEGNYERAHEVLRISMKQEREKQEELRFLRYMLWQSMMLELNVDGEAEEKQYLLDKLETMNLDHTMEFVTDMEYILKEYCKKPSVDEKDTFERVLQFVEDNYSGYDLSLEKVASYAGVSKSKMSKLFKAQTGVGYIEYVTRLRMAKAKELLSETDMSVKEIFLKVGYIDTTNASKKFKAYFKVNPTTWRSMAQEKNLRDLNENETDVDGEI